MELRDIRLSDLRLTTGASPGSPLYVNNLDSFTDMDDFDNYRLFNGALSSNCYTFDSTHYKYGTAAYRFTECATSECLYGGRDHFHVLKQSVLGQEFISGTLKLWAYLCNDGGVSTDDKGVFSLLPRWVDANNFISAHVGTPSRSGNDWLGRLELVEYNSATGTSLGSTNTFVLKADTWYQLCLDVTEDATKVSLDFSIWENGTTLTASLSGSTATSQFRTAASHLCGWRMYLYACNVASLWLNRYADRFEVWP